MNPFTLQKLKMRLISLPPDCQRSALATYPFLKPYMIAASSVASCQAMANEMRNLLEKTLQQIEIQCANGGVPPESTQSSTPTNTSMIGKLESGIGGLFGKKL